ncbi:MAG TPA: hypothetical protein VEI26_01780 [Terriglobales bacterium]|nr:hypothetical protein [Terriglobales bacterium]
MTDGAEIDQTNTSYTFYRVGRFVEGPEKGAELLEASVQRYLEVCKGDCGSSHIVRYIRKGNAIFPLPKISDPQSPDESVGRNGSVDARAFQTLGATPGHPLDFSVPILGYPKTLTAGPRATLDFAEEGIGTPNPSVLQMAFHDPVYGDVWMTKPGIGPQKAFYEDCKDVNPASTGSEEGCLDLPPYTDNSFYFFRPDGTFLIYMYQPDFHLEDPQAVTWRNGPLPAGTSYVDRTRVGCSDDNVNAISVVSPSVVSEADLVPIGKVNVTGDLLYGLKNKNHPLYKEFYADYDSSLPSWPPLENDQPATTREASYEDFLRARPLFLWRDPFGRLIRFLNAQFVIPQTCEPILYLYPEQEEKVEVKLGEDIAITNSYPAYHDGWLVSAQPDGEMMDLGSGRRLPYLFWEGHSYILPRETRGFVVKSSEVQAFLEETLPQLGLNAKETSDFCRAWCSKLNGSPYYFITFLDRSVVDRYYPLRIGPTPDTTIRVFMDFTPLSRPIDVQPLSLAPPVQRRGFTVVEWGVLVR